MIDRKNRYDVVRVYGETVEATDARSVTWKRALRRADGWVRFISADTIVEIRRTACCHCCSDADRVVATFRGHGAA